MHDTQHEFVDIDQLRIGLFIELELGWMAHPFPTGSFKISSRKQIDTLRSLGLKRVRCYPAKSDPVKVAEPALNGNLEGAGDLPRQAGAQSDEATAPIPVADSPPLGSLAAQQQSLELCERRFTSAIDQYRRTVEQVESQPYVVKEQCQTLVTTFVGEVLEGESAIRLLSEGVGEMAYMHPVNVTVIALLLGKKIGLVQSDMVELGLAAFLHDIGKSALPQQVRWPQDNFSPAELRQYQEHVNHSVRLAQGMQLSPSTLQTIAQHHEMTDGSGFPAGLMGDRLSVCASILALVNRYDNLCNPVRLGAALTPHEALSMIFSQLKVRFDSVVLGQFIHLIGVYPPGSVVQLTDDRYAIVVSVNSSPPLKPRVIVYEPSVPKSEALILDLEHSDGLGIRRSLRPASLPLAAMEYLSPRQRMCYFFEKSIPAEPVKGA